MEIRLSVLSENTAGTGRVLAEFGWSILVEVDGRRILFDTGAGFSACHNASVMGIDLGRLDRIVLSHSHHDHTGGLRNILLHRGEKEVEVTAHPHIWANRYNRHSDRDLYMGMPFHRQELEGLGARFNLVVQPIQLSRNALTSGEIGMTTEFERESIPAFGGLGRYLIEESGAKTDTILDDMAILVKTTAGLVVILGCAHRGVINTLIHARAVTGIDKIYAVVGGSHLVSESGGRLEKTIAAFKEFAVERLGLCHCTGPKATARLSQEFQDRFIFCNAGTVHEFP